MSFTLQEHQSSWHQSQTIAGSDRGGGCSRRLFRCGSALRFDSPRQLRRPRVGTPRCQQQHSRSCALFAGTSTTHCRDYDIRLRDIPAFATSIVATWGPLPTRGRNGTLSTQVRDALQALYQRLERCSFSCPGVQPKTEKYGQAIILLSLSL